MPTINKNPLTPKALHSRYWHIKVKGIKKPVTMIVPKADYPTEASALAHIQEIVNLAFSQRPPAPSQFHLGRKMNPPKDGTGEMPLIYGKVERIEMTRTFGKYNGEPFFHNFTSMTACHGLPAGTIIVLPSGKRHRCSTKCLILSSDKGLYGDYEV